MARNKAENFEEIREAILNSAAKVFAAKGFRNTNIIEIGEACNASKSRMYHYFQSKEAMLEEMLTQHVDGLVELARDVVAGKGEPDQRLRDYIYLHLKYYDAGRDRHTVLIEDYGYLSEAAQEKIREAQQTLMGFLATLLQQVNPEKFSARHLASAHAMLIYGMLNWTYTWYKPSGKLGLDVLAAEASDFCLQGVGRKTPA
jgi:AcrR family transcriptional regulator